MRRYLLRGTGMMPLEVTRAASKRHLVVRANTYMLMSPAS